MSVQQLDLFNDVEETPEHPNNDVNGSNGRNGDQTTEDHAVLSDSSTSKNDNTPQKDVMKPKAAHIMLGEIGEELAANWLRTQGYYIIDRNWRPKYKGCELDIVAKKNNELHIVEVKTRSFQSAAYRNPSTAVDEERTREMCNGAVQYAKYHHLHCNYRIHAITIVYRAEDDYDLKFYPNIHEQVKLYDFRKYRYRR